MQSGARARTTLSYAQFSAHLRVHASMTSPDAFLPSSHPSSQIDQQSFQCAQLDAARQVYSRYVQFFSPLVWQWKGFPGRHRFADSRFDTSSRKMCGLFTRSNTRPDCADCCWTIARYHMERLSYKRPHHNHSSARDLATPFALCLTLGDTLSSSARFVHCWKYFS